MRRIFRSAVFGLGLVLALLAGLTAGGVGANSPPTGSAPAQGTPTPTPTGTPPPACGLFWRYVPSADPGAYSITYGVAAIATNDVWAVGLAVGGSGGVSLTEHWDGSSWSIVPSVNPGTSFNFLVKVGAVATNDVWAAGYYSNGSGNRTLLEHWNGSSWSVVASPNQGSGNNNLSGVAAVAANDVWTVGFYNNGSINETLIEHWNGTSWSIIASPNQPSGENELFEVKALATNDVWAVGHYDSGGGVYHTLIEHWNGSSWSIVPSPNVGTASNNLNSLSPLATNNIWAVGSDLSGPYMQSLVLHWDGSTWSVIPSANGFGDTDLRGVAVITANDVWAVGYSGAGAANWAPYSEHWNGSTWSFAPIPNGPVNHNATPWGVAAISATDVWAAGDDSRPMIHHYSDPCTTGTVTPTGTAGAATSTPTRTAGPATQTPPPSNTPAAPTGTPTAGASTSTPPAATATQPPPSNTPVTSTATAIAPSHTPAAATGTPSNTPAPSGNTPTASSTASVRPPTSTPVGSTATRTPAGPTATPCTLSFSDVHPTDYFYTPVLYLACHGVISGYADGMFRPYANTTRAQMVKIVVLGFQKPFITPARGAYTFHDVPPTFPFFLYVETAAADQIVGGYSCGGAGEPCDAQNRPYFRPYNDVTRGQLSKIDVVAAGWPLLNPAQGTFTDVLPGTAFYQFVETAAARNVVSGYACGGVGEPCDTQHRPYFRQSSAAVRGQIAKIVYLSILSP